MPYAPAANTTATASLTHLQTVYYERKGLDTLMKRFVFRSGTVPDMMPLRSGKTIQFYRYTLLGSSTVASSEGSIGVGLPLTTSTISATVSEYSDYITGSTLLKDTALDPIVENATDMLGYRGGLSADTITRTEFDSNVSSVAVNTIGATFSANDLRRNVMLLEGSDVRPQNGDNFLGIIHPYVLYDLMSDNTAGGFIDILKYQNADQLIDGGTAMSGEAGKMAGVRLVKSTNVGTTGSAPNTKYYTYIIGKGAVGAIDLSGNGPSNVTDPSTQAFKINVIQGGPQIADPEGMIGFAVSYRFVFVAKTLDSTTYRYKIVYSDSSII